MKIGIISLGGKSSLELAKACKKYFGSVGILNLKDFKVKLTEGKINVHYEGGDLEEYDCLYVRGSFKYGLLQRAITRALNKNIYMPIKPQAFTIGHDKFLTLLELQKNKLSVPKTYYAGTTKTAKEILKEVNYPIIMKLQEGTHGKGVMIAETLKSAKTVLDLLEGFKKPYIIQEFVPTEGTSDIRAIVCGNKVLASYKRVAAEDEIRTNIHSGGKREKHELSKEEEKLAIASAKIVGCEICGVDILNAKEPSVIEINLSPSLYSVEEISGVNVMKKIAQCLYNQTIKFKEKKEKKMMEKIEKKNEKNEKNDNHLDDNSKTKSSSKKRFSLLSNLISKSNPLTWPKIIFG
tara:strand:- start:5655 stop:6704 length:1050 start_codon:yes stop_codon:yes gene_type:complete